MNVLIVSESLWPYGSGGELATFLFMKLLPKYGVHVRVVVKTGFRARELSGIEIYRISGLGYGKYFVPTYESNKLLTKLVSWSDVVYFASGLFNLIPSIKSLGKPVVVHLHSYSPICPVGSLYNFVTGSACNPKCRVCGECAWLYERSHDRGLPHSIGSTVLNSSVGSYFAKLLDCANALIFVSYAQRNLFVTHLRTILNSSIPRSYIIYNPVPDVKYSEPREVNVGYFGGLSPLKGYHVVLKAWARIFRRYRDRALFMTKMEGLGEKSIILRKINVFAYGRLELNELEQLWSRIGVVVVPSIWQEPAPYAVVETLLCGRLLIASSVGGIPEISVGAPGVRLVPSNDIDSLVDALDWGLSMDPRDVVELGLKNREYVLRKFDNERCIHRLTKIFDKVLTLKG